MPQLSAIMDCASVCAEYDRSLIADGGLRYSGDITKAVGAGAEVVMIGGLFAGTEESPGETILFEGRTFGDVPLNLELKLEVWDSPNSGGVVIDAIRCCKLALDRGLKGALIAPSAYFMKSPPIQYTDDEARRMVEDFIATNKAKKVSSSPR